MVKAERITGVVLCSTKSYLFYRVNFIGNSTGQLFSNATCKYGVILDKHCVVQSSTGHLQDKYFVLPSSITGGVFLKCGLASD